MQCMVVQPRGSLTSFKLWVSMKPMGVTTCCADWLLLLLLLHNPFQQRRRFFVLCCMSCSFILTTCPPLYKKKHKNIVYCAYVNCILLYFAIVNKRTILVADRRSGVLSIDSVVIVIVENYSPDLVFFHRICLAHDRVSTSHQTR